MTRIWAAGLFVALLVAVVWSFVASYNTELWLPQQASSFAGEVDALFSSILLALTVAFVLVMAFLIVAVWRGAARTERARTSHGDARLELLWTLVPAAVLVWIAVAQGPTWRAMKGDAAMLDRPALARVEAAQFDWRFRYPGADGAFDTADDLLCVHELVVPAGEPVVLAMRTRDVIHSFFVPDFRLKQDILPGRDTKLWFQAPAHGQHELVCAELCGWGHYKMAGSVRVVAREEYTAHLAELALRLTHNGTEERP
jgi:cytochrome c oxidase subunit 2